MKDLLEEENYDNVPLAKNGIPKKLNTLTTLTFIGCSIFAIMTILTPLLMPLLLKFMDKLIANGGAELTPKQLEDIAKSRDLMETMVANMIPLMIIGLIGIALRFFGALTMRKLKKDGFLFYVAGHIIPLIGTVVIMGLSQFKEAGSYVGIILAGLFIFLYSKERKLLR